jgi:hypothetical protein
VPRPGDVQAGLDAVRHQLARVAGIRVTHGAARRGRIGRGGGILAPAPGGGQPWNGGPPGAGATEDAAPAGGWPAYEGRHAAPKAQFRPEAFVVTADGAAALTSFGLNIGALERSRRRFAGACLDWTERKPHLNGALGAAMTTRLLGLGWIERGSRRRAVRVTPAGCDGLASTFGWSLGS